MTSPCPTRAELSGGRTSGACMRVPCLAVWRWGTGRRRTRAAGVAPRVSVAPLSALCLCQLCVSSSLHNPFLLLRFLLLHHLASTTDKTLPRRRAPSRQHSADGKKRPARMAKETYKQEKETWSPESSLVQPRMQRRVTPSG